MKRLLTKTIATVILSGCLTTGFAYDEAKTCITKNAIPLLKDLTPIGRMYAISLMHITGADGNPNYAAIAESCAKAGIDVMETPNTCFKKVFTDDVQFGSDIEESLFGLAKNNDYIEGAKHIIELLRIVQECANDSEYVWKTRAD